MQLVCILNFLNETMDIEILNKEGIKTENKKRAIEFDILKGFAIFLVIMGHAILHLSSNEVKTNWLYLFICSFHMPLFMLISGFFSFKALQSPLKEMVKKKFWQLVYPTITFGVIFLLLDFLFSNFQINKGIGEILGGFWFLKSCFLCFVILGISLKLFRGNQIWASLFALFISQGMPFFKLTYMMPFFILGFLLATRQHYLYKKPGHLFLVSTVLFIISFIFYGEENFPLMQVKSALLNGEISIIGAYLNYQSLRLFTGLTGSIMVISLVVWLVEKYGLKKDSFNLYLYGRHTLEIYILQTYFLETLLSKHWDLNMIDETFFTFIFVPLISIAIMDLCYQTACLINKSGLKKYLVEGFGRRSPNKGASVETVSLDSAIKSE